MKKILFAIATLAALASCQKADLAEQNSVNTNGERVITAYFDNAGTKTTLDDNGVTPKWSENDKIMLLDGSGKQEITLDADDISSDGKSVTITVTDLSGTLYAVYPSDATDAVKIETENIVPVTLKAEQDGTFASANICVAKEDDGKLAFKNVTSVLHLTQTEATTNVNEIIITTPSADIAGTGTVNIGDATPALTLSSGQSNKIKVKSASAKSDYYIAVAPTTLPAGTAFGFATGSKLGGTNLSEERAIVANTIYNIGSMDVDAITPNTYHDYVEIEMTVNSVTKKYKWATMNIGASSAPDAGKYFMWGETTGITPSGSSFSFPDSKYYSADNNSWDQTKGFKWENCPWTNGTYKGSSNKNVFTKYVTSAKTDYWGGTGSPDGKTTLDLADDAANANWGGSWRMPTKEEFDALALLQTGDFESGYNFGTADAKIFLPAANYGNGTGLDEDDDDIGYYWSSSLNTDDPCWAYYLFFGEGLAVTSEGNRYYGRPVRALSD